MREKVKEFEDLEVWQKSVNLAVALCRQLEGCRGFGMKNQMQRAAVSVAPSVAEGFDRQTQKEFIQFLYVARGSCAEVRTQLHIASQVGLIRKQEAELLHEQTKKISAMLYNLI